MLACGLGMKLLTFLSPRFAWRAWSRTLEDAPRVAVGDEAERRELSDVVVVFVHAQAGDEEEAAARRALRHVVKHVKWLANKRGFRRVALHSFTHLGAENADPSFARGFLDDVAERLRGGGFEVAQTPFGHFCEWELSVHGESLAKVWKEI